ncbi:DNA polymerase III subunit psi [Chania multitudinisentens RB-25]|uniref:DNA polymerase III subunit psi n=1 Tax=Chania multitudinisentens RB-25 TaxID=1441930 RepID=W0LKQ6_9GAMM|nr:DNA polymerase III subunit psi [Chania multitudinisentens]AHG22882.1 DNA polymerase III subunit psi [Chania multitudinisentens RB-25]
MASRRDELLQQLGITQWILRRPAVLRGEIAVSLPPDVRLLVIAQVLPDRHDPLFCDVLHSLGLTPGQTYGLTPDQVVMLPADTACNSWRLGIAEPLALAGAQLYSPALAELSQDASAKRALWQQICHYYEQHFTPDSGRFGHSLQD